MRQHELSAVHPRKTARRVGRGIAAGQGKTAGRGTKGQKSRTGANSNIPHTFSGGGTPLVQRLPKLKGFKSRATKPVTVSLSRILPLYEKEATVTLVSLVEKNLVSPKEALQGVKVVGAKAGTEHALKFETENTKLRFSKNLLAA